MLIGFLYVAEISEVAIGQADHFVELVQSETREASIGSIALLCKNYYIHYMEGDRAAVNNRYCELLQFKDYIHCTILRCVEMYKCEFPDFVLKYANLSDIAKDELDILGTIDPATISSATAMTLIRRSAAHHRYDEQVFPQR